jgi:purine-binding chemotaxis protein CheW
MSQSIDPPSFEKLPRSGLAEEVLGALAGPVPPASLPSHEIGARNAGGGAPEALCRFADGLNPSSACEEKAQAALETWVIFRSAGESYGLPVAHVQEILRVGNITQVPQAPAWVRGITNLRGKVLPVVDFRLRLGFPGAPEDAEACRILVMEAHGRRIGLIVDSVRQVARLDMGGVAPAPNEVMTDRSQFIRGVCDLEGGLVILLDALRLLSPSSPTPAANSVSGLS